MKQINIFFLLLLSLGSYPLTALAQDTLPNVTVVSRNYKYLRSVDNQESSQPVRLLERQAAAFDIKNLDIYSEDYETYYISFYLPQGYILAAYDSQGKLLN
ncbi:MAG: nicotinate-nucleotide adenylyltransferase, partial [Sphingobacteriales bacterium]